MALLKRDLYRQVHKAGISVSRVPTYQQPRWAVVWISSEHNC
jgi:hypothetical protein